MMTTPWQAERWRVALARTCTQSKPRNTINPLRNRVLPPFDSLEQIANATAEARNALL